KFTGEGEHALALHLVAEGGNGKKIGPQRQLVPGEQGARGDGEITAARLAAPSRMGRRSRARVADRAAAARTDWSAVSAGPAQAQKHILDPAVGHAHDLGSAERARRRRQQEMLRQRKPLAGGPNQHSPARVCQKVQPRIRWWRELHKAAISSGGTTS